MRDELIKSHDFPHSHPRRQPKVPAGGKKYKNNILNDFQLFFIKESQIGVMDGAYIRPYLPPLPIPGVSQSSLPEQKYEKKTHVG